jgi:hypothetical protein
MDLMGHKTESKAEGTVKATAVDTDKPRVIPYNIPGGFGLRVFSLVRRDYLCYNDSVNKKRSVRSCYVLQT